MPLLAVRAWIVCCVCSAAAASAEDAGRDLFEKKIRPVLVAECYQCHSHRAGKSESDLFVDSRAGLRNGGVSGPAVVPGDPESSVIIEALRHETFEMPPEKRLPQHVIDDFVAWIRLGAPDPREVPATPGNRPVSAAGGRVGSLWSLQPLQPVEVPTPRRSGWSRSAIDDFVLQRLEAADIPPAPDADRRTLIRRLYFDLTGLPPTPAELTEALGDEAPDAIVRLVDRLLSSPEFGVHWGRHWLDVARYSDSSGGGRAILFRDAWRYRDYVIASWNADKPFDQFVQEQIAGDLLPATNDAERAAQLAGTGFLVLGPTNFELQDKELLRMEVVDEQLDTIGRAFLGLSFGCARCHDHRFAPIAISDYYALAGILRSTKTLTPGNVSGFVTRPLPVPETRQRQLDAHAEAVDAVEQQLADANARLKELGGTVAESLSSSRLPGLVLDDRKAAIQGDWTLSRSVQGFVDNGYIHDANDAKGQKWVTFRLSVADPQRYEVRIAYTPHGNRASNVPVVISHADGTALVRVNQRQTPDVDGVFARVGEYRFRDAATVRIETSGTNGVVIADAVQLVPVSTTDPNTQRAEAPRQTAPETETASEAARAQQRAEVEKRVARLQAELKQLKRSAPTPAPVVMSVRDESEPADCPICIRGDVHHPGRSVPRGFPSVFPDSGIRIPAEVSGRLELAQWLVHPENPLTARVVVNRIWRHLMGRGLVETVDDFGNSGAEPSHPELLDWLAMRLRNSGWSTKFLIRDIVLSRTWQLSSQAIGPGTQRDPDNRLLWHHTRRRLLAEELRDAMLAIGDTLDSAQGGRSIPPQTNSEFGFEFASTRRSVYLPVFRNALPDVLDVFDFPNPNLVSGDRVTSTLPTQALLMMNSPFVWEQAQQAARRLLERTADGPAADNRARLCLAYTLALGREPSESEQAAIREFLESAGKDGSTDSDAHTVRVWSRVFQVLFGSVDFRYLD